MRQYEKIKKDLAEFGFTSLDVLNTVHCKDGQPGNEAERLCCYINFLQNGLDVSSENILRRIDEVKGLKILIESIYTCLKNNKIELALTLCEMNLNYQND